MAYVQGVEGFGKLIRVQLWDLKLQLAKLHYTGAAFVTQAAFPLAHRGLLVLGEEQDLRCRFGFCVVLMECCFYHLDGLGPLTAAAATATAAVVALTAAAAARGES
jgi:hypothetical protein